MTHRIIRKAAVIGAGTMGAAIAAHLANAGIPVYLLDIVPTSLTPEEEAKGLTLKDPEVRNRIVMQGLERMKKSKPAALFSEDRLALITPGNMEDNFDWVGEADWVIEAVIERLDIKQQVMARIEEVRKPDAIVSTNTSGIPLRLIGEGRSEAFLRHFLGTHFFNPPRYLKLVEIIPGPGTDPEILEFMTEFVEKHLGKRAVRAKDTPNFIGNRLMVITGAFITKFAIENDYTVEEVDAILGKLIGRPKTAHFRLMDLVGIDVMDHVSRNLYEAIPHDPFRDLLTDPNVERVTKFLLEKGWLGNKTGQGFYKRVKQNGKKEFWHLNLKTLEYEPPAKPRWDSVKKAKDIEDLGERLRFLVQQDDKVGRLVWATLANQCSYAGYVTPEIADDIINVDNAMRWGFNHEMGPFEVWDALGVAETVERMEKDGYFVADWVKEMLANGHPSFYQYENGRVVGYYDFKDKAYKSLPTNPNVIVLKDLKAQGKEIERNLSASLIDLGDGVLLLEFHTKANALDPDIFKMYETALKRLDTDFDGMVVGNQGEHFCAGANVFNIAMAGQQKMVDMLHEMVKEFQSLMMAVRYFPKPIVAAPFGMTLGGGAEVVMAASRVVASAETYMGLVETGVGLIPAGGGCKELLRRVVNPAMRTQGADPLPFLQRVFEQIAMAKVATSAEEARQMGFLTAADRIVMNPDFLIAEAKKEVLELVRQGYHPPVPEKIYAGGRDMLAALRIAVWSLREANYITDHEVKIANHLAYVLAGGDHDRPTWVDEWHILNLEREAFVELAQEPKTLERIWNFLKTGKVKRN